MFSNQAAAQNAGLDALDARLDPVSSTAFWLQSFPDNTQKMSSYPIDEKPYINGLIAATPSGCGSVIDGMQPRQRKPFLAY